MARDLSGQVIATRAGRQEQAQDAFGAEVQAMAGAVALAADIGAVRVAFETDSQLLAEALDIRKTNVPLSAASCVLGDMPMHR